MAIRKFKADDMLKIIEKGVREFGLKSQGTDELRELAQSREDNGICLTEEESGEIMACGGIDLLWRGVGEVWLLLTCKEEKYPRELYINLRKGLDKLIKDNNLHRVQAFGRIGFDRAHILFKHLGFQAEGIARQYTPDKCDCIIYSLVNNG